MEFKYQKAKKFDIIKWFRNGNAPIYLIILLVFVSAVILIFNSVNKYNSQEGNGEESSGNSEESQIDNEASPSDAEKDTETVVNNSKRYMIKINKTQNFVNIYAINEDGSYEPYLSMNCSVNANVGTGKFSITGKQTWINADEYSYGHYASLLSEGIVIHSVPYWKQNNRSLCVECYNNLGSPASRGSICLEAADAKWIFENCYVDTVVEIYEKSGETPEKTLSEIKKLSSDAYQDPSDK